MDWQWRSRSRSALRLYAQHDLHGCRSETGDDPSAVGQKLIGNAAALPDSGQIECYGGVPFFLGQFHQRRLDRGAAGIVDPDA